MKISSFAIAIALGSATIAGPATAGEPFRERVYRVLDAGYVGRALREIHEFHLEKVREFRAPRDPYGTPDREKAAKPDRDKK